LPLAAGGRWCEGPAKKNRRTFSRTFAKSQTHPPPLRLFFALTFVFSTFLGVSRQGEFKNTIKIFLQKVHVESRKLFPKFRQKISMSVFPRLFLFYRVFGCFSAMGVQKTTKTFYKKNRVEKFLQKNRPKTQNRLYLDFFYHVFGRFSMRGVQKRD
jgi:hypothetical protein